MSKTIFLTMSLVFTALILKQAATGLGMTDRSGISISAFQNTQPAVGLRWTEAGAQNQISFKLSPIFLVVVGIAGPIGLVPSRIIANRRSGRPEACRQALYSPRPSVQ